MSEQELLLKLEHYKQRVAQLAVEYEDQVSNLRVQLTLLSNKLAELEPNEDATEDSKED